MWVGGGRALQTDPTNYCMRGQLESRTLCPEDARLNFLIDKMRNRSQGKMAISSINDIAAMTIDHIFHIEQVCVCEVMSIIQNLEIKDMIFMTPYLLWCSSEI